MNIHSLEIGLCAAMTLDGRLGSDDNRKIRLGSDDDIQHLRQIRNNYQASLMGGQTFRNWPIPPSRDNQQHYIQFVATKKGIKEVLENMVIDQWGHNKLVFIYGDSASFIAERQLVQKYNFDTHLLEKNLSLKNLFPIFQRYNISKILLEGGGSFCHQFFHEHVIQDLYLTLVPKILGGHQSKGLCIGNELSATRNYSLKNIQSINDEVFLHYIKI